MKKIKDLIEEKADYYAEWGLDVTLDSFEKWDEEYKRRTKEMFIKGSEFRIALQKNKVMDLLIEFSEHDTSIAPNNGEIRTISDNNWDNLADAIIDAISGNQDKKQ